MEKSLPLLRNHFIELIAICRSGNGECLLNYRFERWPKERKTEKLLLGSCLLVYPTFIVHLSAPQTMLLRTRHLLTLQILNEFVTPLQHYISRTGHVPRSLHFHSFIFSPSGASIGYGFMNSSKTRMNPIALSVVLIMK